MIKLATPRSVTAVVAWSVCCSVAVAGDLDLQDHPYTAARVAQAVTDQAEAAPTATSPGTSTTAASTPAAGYGGLLLEDTGYILTAPMRWRYDEWRNFSLATLGILGTVAVLDKPIRDAAQRNRNSASDRIARTFEPFGAEYSFGVLGGFYLAGVAFDDPKAVAVAQDGFAASLIASGIITPALKFAAGRSRPSQNEGVHDFQPFHGGTSFPSGHATQAFAVASVIATHYEPFWVKAAAYGTASLVGFARIDHNAHFASDVLAGALIGSMVGQAIVPFNQKQRASQVSLAPLVGHGAGGLAVNIAF